jgi:hypothetical protein
VFVLVDEELAKGNPISNKKCIFAFESCQAKHNVMTSKDDIVGNFDEPNVVVGQFGDFHPLTKETSVVCITPTTRLYRLASALGLKVTPTMTTSFILPLRAKCQM